MRIVFDARLHFPAVSGMSRYIVNLLANLLVIDSKNEYIVLVNGKLLPDDEIFNLQKFDNVQFKTIHLPHMGLVNYLLMPRIIRKLKPDLYHYPMLDAPIVCGVKTISTVHDANVLGSIKKYEDRFGIKTLYFKKALANTLRKASRIIFISKASRSEILASHQIPESSKHVLIYNGFNAHFGEISPEIIQQVADKFHLTKPFFLYVGQIREHKNVLRMIEAFLQTNSDWEFIIAGNNYMNVDFSVYPSQIRYISMVSDDELKGLYYHSKAFVFPSFIEGFGFPILESLSFGKPIIGTQTGAIAEISGPFLIGVDPFSVDDIASKMHAFQSGNIAPFEISKAHNYLLQFSWEKCATEVLALYKQVNQSER